MQILQWTYWNFVLAFQEILKMFDNLMKYRKVSKTIILTNFENFVQFMKILSEGSF